MDRRGNSLIARWCRLAQRLENLHLWKSKTIVLVLFLFHCLVPVFAHSQDGSREGEGSHGKRNIQAIRTELPVVLDGDLDEPVWQTAPIALGFIQRDPQQGQPSTEKTEFRILYNATTIYIGVVCYDSNPVKFWPQIEGGTASWRTMTRSLCFWIPFMTIAMPICSGLTLGGPSLMPS